MTSTIHADKIMNSSGDQDSGVDLLVNDQVKLKTANTDRITVTDATTTVANALAVTGESTLTGGAKVNTIKHTGGTTGLTVNSSGLVNKPNQPCFRASVRNQTGSTVGVTGNLIFNREVIDIGNNYDTSNGRFTAPVAGTYYFSHAGLGASGGSGSVHTSGASWHCEFLLNGSRTFFQFYWYAGNTSGGQSQGQYINCYMDMVITLSAGDYITVQLPDGTDSYYINPNSNATYEPYFQGWLIA